VSSLFWDDLAANRQDPEFEREYAIESMRIATIDTIINTLDEARVAAGWSKAQLARAIGAEPATVRRLFSAHRPNPTLGTLAEVATALGLRISVEPLPTRDHRAAGREAGKDAHAVA
jgi:DNA-binding phage protein